MVIMNIFLTSAGRRNYLVGYFQRALELVGIKGKVLAGDADPMAAALGEADKAIILPPFRSGEYVEALLEHCRRNGVGLLIPLNDVELPILATATNEFLRAGVRVAVSSAEVIGTCFDKIHMGEFLVALGLTAPRTYTSLPAVREAIEQDEIQFPMVVKPRWGSGSIGLEFVDNISELELAYHFSRQRVRQSILAGPSAFAPDDNILIQERIQGVEFGLDVVNNFDGKNVASLGRRKIAMRGGETDKAVTVNDPKLFSLGSLIGKHLGHVGNLDCDVIVSDQGSYVIDMNPRFGGGYPFSHMAGANIPACLLCWATGRPVNERWLQVIPNVASAKCDRLVPIGDH
jgi:carbamoyl-phosphate synthase large subunit